VNSNTPQKVGAHLDSLVERGDLEKMCVKCGVCCFVSIPVKLGDKVYKIAIPELPCKFLVREGQATRVCSVYPTRHAKAPWCMDLFQGAIHGTFPTFCPYVKSMDGYVGSNLLSEEHYNRVRDTLKKAVSEIDLQAVSERDLQFFLDN